MQVSLHWGRMRLDSPRSGHATISADTVALPRIPTVDPTAADRPVVSVTTAPSGFEGEGFPVRRAFAGVDLRALDPFVHMDQMGEVDYAPGEPKGTPWHPHRGFETVTYMLDGILRHHDSNGGGGLIAGGDTQWMTAGRGLIHIEAPPEEVVVRGGLFHGFQLWVNLPARLKMTPPRYQDIGGQAVTLLSSPDGGALLRVIAGEVAGHQGPGITYTPIALLHATSLPAPSCGCPGERTSTRWCTCSPVPARWVSSRGRRASWPSTAPARWSPWPPTPARSAAAPSSTCWSWAASPSLSRSPPTARS
jgi:redox-sensitive bicupin YhaK (pirin superfamily)